jgi:hypothetical protein
VDELQVVDNLAAALKMHDDMRKILDAASTAIINDRRNLDKRENLAPNFFYSFARLSGAMNQYQWYTIFQPVNDMILKKIDAFSPLTTGAYYWYAVLPEPESMSTSLAGMNNSTRIVGVGMGTGFGVPSEIGFGDAGLLIRRGWKIQVANSVAGNYAAGILHLVANTAGIQYLYF